MLTDAFDRRRSIERLADETFDVLVIGGGLFGAASALDAASRGLATALVEADDFAAGSSSMTSKLVCGTTELTAGRVAPAERLSELAILRNNASFLLWNVPVIEPGRRSPRHQRTGRIAARFSLSRRRPSDEWQIDRDAVLDRIPSLRPEASSNTSIHTGAVVDDARLTLAMARTAAIIFGTRCTNRASVERVRHDASGHAVGAEVALRDATAAIVVDRVSVAARTIIDARPSPRPQPNPSTTRLYLAVEGDRLVADSAYLSPQLSIVPWLDHVMLGIAGDFGESTEAQPPAPSREQITEALVAARSWVDHDLDSTDVTGAWFGPPPRKRMLIRPGGRVSALVSDDGVITAHTDDLTESRRLAADAVDIAVTQLGHEVSIRPSRTKRIELIGSGSRDDVGGLSIPRLWHRYGTESRVVQAIMRSHPDLAVAARPDSTYILGEVVYAARYEMACSIDDVLSRRWRVGLLDAAQAADLAPQVADLLAAELGWDEQTKRSRLDQFVAMSRPWLTEHRR
ncbi:MAG: FAD-dependent oxidoreductase [Acidimicrobiales bacterium]|nr:FAD-dependent oxidoreductase [Acidimicrobiales bacterium]